MSQALSFKSHSVRVHAESEQLWFVAKDVCVALNISWTSHTLDAIPESWQGVVKLTTPRGGRQNFVTINEAGTYKLAFRSNKPEADAFTNWVASEVLPAIRQTGKFEASPKQAALESDMRLPEPNHTADARLEVIFAGIKANVRLINDQVRSIYEIARQNRYNALTHLGTPQAVVYVNMHLVMERLFYSLEAVEAHAKSMCVLHRL